MKPKDQIRSANGAKILIAAHGAGLSNLCFTQPDCHIIEFNFRRHCYCDPSCDLHYHGKLPLTEECEGSLNFMPSFHKADYHNLAHLYGRPYQELELEDIRGEVGRNPITRAQLYVDEQKLLSIIKSQAALIRWSK